MNMEERTIEVRLRQMIRELDALARRKNAVLHGMCPPPPDDRPPADRPPADGRMPTEPPIDGKPSVEHRPPPAEPLPGDMPTDHRFPMPPDAESPAMGRVLDLLCDTDGMVQVALARALRIRPQSLSELLCRMEQKGLVCRVPSDTDKRQSIVRVTDSGREKAAEMRKIHERAALALFAPLTNAEKETLAALLQKVIAAGEADPV